jgi:hypothetical protein
LNTKFEKQIIWVWNLNRKLKRKNKQINLKRNKTKICVWILRNWEDKEKMRDEWGVKSGVYIGKRGMNLWEFSEWFLSVGSIKMDVVD